jgi:hypothetical protein
MAVGAGLKGVAALFGWAAVRVWALPTTLIGLVLASTAVFGGHTRVSGGVVEAWGGALRWLLRAWPPGAAAMALGHVILAMTEGDLERHRGHERVHVRQCERWGLLFLPAYALSSLWAWARGRDPYLENRFEREAFAWEAPAGEARLAAGTRSNSSVGTGQVADRR